MEYSFPFDSVLDEETGQPDRLYYAEDWKRMLQHYFTDGVFPNPVDNLEVLSLNNNMVVTVKAGYGHVRGATYTTDEDLHFALNTADHAYNRIDTIVLRLDEVERTVRVLYVQGDPSGNPVPKELERNNDAWELKLAEITVRSGTQVISPSDILDTRLNTEECGIVACIPEGVDTSTIYNQYYARWQEVLADINHNDEVYNAWYTAFCQSAASGLNQRYSEWDNRISLFDAWFNDSKTSIFDARYFDFDNWTYRAGETKKTIFNPDGSITEKIVNSITATEAARKDTAFNSDGSIAEHLVMPELTIDVTKTTVFNPDGSIDEVIV